MQNLGAADVARMDDMVDVRHGRERLVGQLSMRVGYEADNGHDELLLCINRSNGKYRSYAGLHATH